MFHTGVKNHQSFQIPCIVGVLFFYAGMSLLTGCDSSEEIKKAVQLKSAEIIANIAQRNIPDDAAGGFHKIPIEVRQHLVSF